MSGNQGPCACCRVRPGNDVGGRFLPRICRRRGRRTADFAGKLASFLFSVNGKISIHGRTFLIFFPDSGFISASSSVSSSVFLPGFRFYFSFIFRFIFRFLYSGCFFPPGTRCFFAESGGKKKRKMGEGREEKSGTGNKMILPMSLSNGYLAGLFSEQDSEEQLLS